jgi:hypothetical protein
MITATDNNQYEQAQLIAIDTVFVKWHLEYDNFREAIKLLESAYSNNSDDAAAHEELAEIRVIIDKANEFARNRQFCELYNASQYCICKIKDFQSLRDEKAYKLPHDVYFNLRKLIDIHVRSLDIMLNGLQAFNSFCLRDIQHSKTKEMGIWANALESLGDALEDNIDLISLDLLQGIQPLFWSAIEKTQKKPLEEQTRHNKWDSYRIRIRNAAGFISRLIDYRVEESDKEENELLSAIANANHPIFFDD